MLHISLAKNLQKKMNYFNIKDLKHYPLDPIAESRLGLLICEDRKTKLKFDICGGTSVVVARKWKTKSNIGDLRIGSSRSIRKMTLNQAALRASFVFTLFQLIGCENSEFYQKQLSASSSSPDPGAGQDITDNFTQNNQEYGNVDILWVVDNSGSMANEQASLASNFSVFIDRFKDQDINFKMGIVTTDPRVGFAGVPVAGSLNLLTYANAQADENAFINNFINMVQVGINGSGNEQGLYSSQKFFENNSTWLRDDAT